jgi:multiple sugar transport system substrate-binding protein
MPMTIRGLALAAMATTCFYGSVAAADTELTFRYAYDNVDEIQAGLDRFEELNPGITVTMERVAFKDARDQLIREGAAGAGPDVAHLAFVWIKDLGTAGACMPLNELIEEHGIGENGFQDFIATDLVLGDDEETIYGVPFATDTWGMIYNTEIMKEAGIEKVPETWEELLEASRKAKAIGKIGFGFAAGTSAANTIWFLANFNWWSDGGTLVESDGAGGYRLGISADQVASVIDYYKTYLDEDLTVPGALAMDAWNDPTILEQMIAGDMFATSVPVFTAVQIFDQWRERNPEKELPFTTAMTPHGSGKPTTHLGGQSLCVNANTDYPEESWKLMQWLNSWEFFENYNTGYYPAQQALLVKKPFPAEMTGFQKQFSEGARSWGPYARGPAAIGAMWNQTSRSFGAAFIGEKTSKEAADELLAFVQGLL